jgi:hypothetical protein
MKNMTIWQRLNTALLLLILLLIVGVGLAVWGEKTSANVELHEAVLDGAHDHLCLETVRLSEFVRGLVAQPRSERDKQPLTMPKDAEGNIRSALAKFETKQFSNYTDLQTAARKVREFAVARCWNWQKLIQRPQ